MSGPWYERKREVLILGDLFMVEVWATENWGEKHGWWEVYVMPWRRLLRYGIEDGELEEAKKAALGWVRECLLRATNDLGEGVR